MVTTISVLAPQHIDSPSTYDAGLLDADGLQGGKQVSCKQDMKHTKLMCCF